MKLAPARHVGHSVRVQVGPMKSSADPRHRLRTTWRSSRWFAVIQTVVFAFVLLIVEHHSVMAVSIVSLLFGLCMWPTAADARRELASTTPNPEPMRAESLTDVEQLGPVDR